MWAQAVTCRGSQGLAFEWCKAPIEQIRGQKECALAARPQAGLARPKDCMRLWTATRIMRVACNVTGKMAKSWLVPGLVHGASAMTS